MTSTRSVPEAERVAPGGTAAQTFQADLACAACAEAVERRLRETPHVTGVHVEYAARTVHVTFHAGLISPVEIQRVISTAAYGCHCKPETASGPQVGGDLQALAHQAGMASVTMGTAVDRMQYEFPATAAGHLHHVQAGVRPGGPMAPVSGHRPHAAHAGMATAPVAAPAGHAAMGHDMSDPRLARAMEADMRTRFFVALALTIPTIVFSPLVMNTVPVRVVGMATANWLMLLFSTPVVWWSGWPFIGGAVTSLRHRALNMSVLIATGVLAAWGFSVLFTLTSGGETFYEAAAMLVTFVLFGHWMEMKSRRGHHRGAARAVRARAADRHGHPGRC